MSIEAEIARHMYEKFRDPARENMSVRLPLRIAEYQRLWPGASKDEILRAHLIAYEMLVNDVAEALAAASGEEWTFNLKGTQNDEGNET